MSSDVQTRLKRQAAAQALRHVRSGMTVGLGGGSTAALFIQALGRALAEGCLSDVAGVPSAQAMAAIARQAGVPLTDMERCPCIDVCVDGADEVDPDLNLIKGGGGFLTREKILAQASAQVIIVVDESKLSPRLGTRWAVPVEVLPFGWVSQQRFLQDLGALSATLRLTSAGHPWHTDQGNLLLDAAFGPLAHPTRIAARLAARAGIVEHGLFLGLATTLITAYADEGVVERTRPAPARRVPTAA